MGDGSIVVFPWLSGDSLSLIGWTVARGGGNLSFLLLDSKGVYKAVLSYKAHSLLVVFAIDKW